MLALSWAISAHAVPPYVAVAVALEGQAAPAGVGGTFSSFGHSLAWYPVLNDSGDVAFRAEVTGGSASVGVFLYSGGTITILVLAGDAAPDSGGGSFDDFEVVSINGSGDVAFDSVISGGTASQGLYVASGGSLTTVAMEGDSAPDTGGGTYSGLSFPLVNDVGDVAFYAAVSGGTATAGGSNIPCSLLSSPTAGTNTR